MDRLTTYAMLAHNARENLKEMSSNTKVEKNDELWLRVQSGMPLPKPKKTFAYDKFVGLIKGMGVNVKEDGTQLSLMPLTDENVTDMSSGKLTDPMKVISRNKMLPEKGGLFDPDITGGLRGEQWSHIDLESPVPNPMLEKGVLSLTGLKKDDYMEILAGNKNVDDLGNIID